MIYTNYHSHSKYCDGSGLLEDYARGAIDKGFSAVGFSSHAPLPFPNDWTMSEKNLKDYLHEAAILKEKYKDRIEIYTGLEIDYIEGIMSPSDEIYRTLELDYSIGSVHVLKDKKTGEYPGIDYTEADMEQLLENNYGGDIRLLIGQYYSAVRQMLKKGGFNILGHMDVVKKTNINSKYFNENESWYRNEVLKTLEVVRETGQIVEVNTGNTRRKGIESLYPASWILKICHKMGIPITLNSDAHSPARIAIHFPEALKVIYDAGYREIMYLKNNIWIPKEID